ncbi:MAG: glycosyltransferase [Bacteroidales bacterium]|nr:glycosyltransferase [Bacteroidales bacterium]
MKILHIVDFGKSKGISGMTEAVINLSNAQKRAGAEVLIGSTRDHPAVDDKFIINIHKLNNFRNLFSTFNPDVVVFNSFYDFHHPLYAYFLRKKRIPYLIAFHGGASPTNFKKHKLKKTIANYFIFNSYISKANGVIYLNENESNKSIFKRLAPHQLIIPNGINLHNNKHRDYDIETRIEILFLSRLDRFGKGLDVLLQTLSVLKVSEINKKIHFSFYGPTTDNIQDDISKLNDIASYQGIATDKIKHQVFSQSDILILPSRSEGMPMSILEALSFGLPCIVTPETNMAEIVTKNNCGWSTSLTVESLQQTILKAVNQYSSDWENLTKNAIMTSRKFNWDEIAEKSLISYESVI